MLFDKFALTAQQIVNKKLFTWGLNTAGQLGYTNIPTSFAQISAGQSHTLAITNTGLLYAWGLGTSGQLGDSTAVTKSSPVLVSGSITNWKQVTTGDTFSLGITTDGKLYAWGNNANSQLGNIATVNRSAPLQIGITSWTQVTAGTNHVLAIASNGLLYGWGLNNIGQVGAIANYSQSWSQISVGPSHVTAIRDNGLLFAWGLNSAGQLGDFTAISKSSPVQIGGASTWSKVSSGNNFTLAIKTNGSLWGWGLNTSYQLGDNTQTNRNSPVQISVGRSFINVAAGFDHSLAIDTSSNLYTWGNSTSISVYLFPPSTTFSWTQVSKGSSYTAAIRSDGKLFTWGLNSSGQLGDGTTITRSSPVQIGTGSWVKISAGSSHMAAINFDNSWLTWGLGTSGQLGDNTIVSKSSPVQIGVGSWTNVSAGNNFTTAISSDGKLYASGINASSQLGDGTTINKSAPVQLSATVPSTSWSQISAGFDHSLAIDNQGIMYSWGKYASIGPVSTEPTKLNSWTRVSTGDRHTLAINNDGKLFAWGVNTSGQMGVGSTGATVFSSPVQVGTANSWTSVCAGSLASIGIANDTLYGWGRNFGAGALGQGSIATGYYFTPVTMPTYPGVPSVLAVGDDVTMVINTLGQLWTCGSNGFGQLGNGSAISRSSAVQVSGSWTSVSIQQAVAVGLSNGVAYAWGSGSNGALGDGTTINKSAPVQIGTGPYVKAYATGANIYLIDSLARMYATGSSSSIPDGTAISKSTPVQISGSWASVGINTGSGGRTLGIKTDGTLWEWGLGATNPNTPTQIGSRTDWSLTVQPAASSQFATPTATLFSAVDNSGSLYQWGINADNSGGATGPISNTIPTLIGNNTPNSGNSPYYIDNANSYTQISAGTSFSLAIRNNSTLYAWGLNSSGQLGTNNTTNLNVVTQIGLVNTSSWTQISAGVSTATVIGNDGTLWVWGSNASGQLGDGTTINKSLPVQIAGSWTLVSTGINSTGAIKSDSTLYGWGSGTAGETGDSANVSKSSPVLIGNIPNLNQPTIPTLVVGNSWSQISVGTSYQLATDANNNLYTWGLNSSGQLGLGTDTIARSNPVFIRSNTVQISAGTSHAALINNVGELYAWGLNSIGQLGDNSSITKSSPVQIGIGTSWNVVAAGSTNTIATRNDGTLFAWGQNLNGEIGNNTNIVNSNPVQIGNLSWSVVGAQGSTTAGITSNGNAYLWGSNGSGSVGDVTAVTKSSPVQLGNNSVSASSPVQVVSGGVAGSWLQVSAAANYTVGIDVNYKLYAWGENTLGKLGDNSSDRRNSPVLINETNSWLLVNAGLNHAFAITYDNSLYGWGRNTEGQVGDSTTINKSVPVLLAGPSAYKNISAGNNNSAGIGINNLLYGWGNNSTGQLGLADTLNRSSPTQIGTSSWTQVSIGGTQTQGILIDRTLYAWGTNTNGTLGVNDTINRSSPILIGATALVSQSSPTQLGALSWSKISSSISHTLAIRSDGLLYGWGLNSSGQLGLVSDTIARSSPTQLGTGSSWKFVAAGLAHSLAVKSDNTLWAWGLNSSGQLGQTNDTIARSSPVLVTSFSWNAISAGASHSVGITSDNSLYVWGNNSSGQLGLTNINAGGDTLNRSAPTQVQPGTNWYTVSAGQTHTVAINTNYNLYAWGLNTNFQLGDTTTIARSSPVLISASSWSQVSAGTDHNLAISIDGTLWAWGSNTLGQLGLYTMPYSWSQVAEGNSFTAAIRSDGLLFTWGINTSGQLGTGDTLTRSSPVQIGTSTWNQVFAGANTMGVIDSTGVAYIWGNNLFGQIGDGTLVSKSSPVLVSGIWTNIASGTDHSLGLTVSGQLYTWGAGATGQTGQLTDVYSWTIVSENNSHVMAIRSDNKLFGWGLNSLGQLGISDTLNRSSPVQIGTDNWREISSGGTHTIGIKSNNKLFVWGNNSVSQLGDDTTINKSSPIQIGTSDWNKVTAGTSHSLAIDSAGLMYGWGRGVEGQLGLLTTTYSWSTVSAGATHASGIRSDGKLFAWGLNGAGQVGLISDTIARSSPVQIGTSTWSALSNGSTHSLAVRNDGTLWAWGDNTGGQLGQITSTIARSSPIQIGTSSWTSVSAGNSFTLAINNTNKLYAWGLNSSSQLGDATTINKSSPIQVGNSSWSVISAGFNHVTAIDSSGRLFTWGSGTGIGLVVEPQSWTAINSGLTATHVLAVRNDGTLWSWGTNAAGQLGTNDILTRSSPVQVGTANSWSQVDVGTSYSLAIRNDGILFGWGLNSSGQLGLITDIAARSNPVQIGSSSWTSVSTGSNFVLGRTIDGKLFAWGANNLNQLGDGTTVARSSPVQITAGTSYNQASAGLDHSLAIRNDGKLYGWGNPSALVNLTDRFSWTQVSEGPSHTVAIYYDNTLWAWGLNTDGQLGDNTNVSKSSPVQISTGSWSSVSAGDNHTLAINALGQLFAWGSGTSMQTGLGGTVTATQETLSRSSPIQIGVGSSWTSIHAGVSYSLARTTTSLLYGWGLNSSSQLGDGTTINKSSPIQIGTSSWTNVATGSNHALGIDALGKLYVWGSVTGASILTNLYSWSQVSIGVSHTVAVRSDGLLFGWGTNALGQLGTSDTISRSSPVQVGTSSWTRVSAGTDHTLAINSTGQLFAWGAGAMMQTGLGGVVTAGQETLSRSSPIQIGTANSWSQVSAGASYSLARTTTNTLYGWGLNATFQLGLGTDTLARSSPAQVGTNTWYSVSAGLNHALAIDNTSRDLYVWGASASVSSLTPIFSWTQITQSAGASHLLAIRADGRMFGWGYNATGQLGTGDTIDRSSPVQIGSSSWSQVSTGANHSLAITTDGKLFAWGAGNFMQTGFGGGTVPAGQETLSRSSPIQIGTTNSWSNISAGWSFSLARTTTGLLYGWGLNNFSQLGDGTTINKSSPVQIGTSSWNTISAGFDHALAIDSATNGLWGWGNPTGLLSSTSQFSWTLISGGGSVGNFYTVAIRNDGGLFTWGSSVSGKLGSSTVPNPNSPVQIGTSSWSQVSAGDDHTLAITTDGKMFAWGAGNFMQTGFGGGTVPAGQETLARSSPIQIGTANSWSQVSAGSSYSLARTTTGLLYGWGLNTSNQLGDGTIINKSFPVQIGTTSWNNISAGFDHALAIDSATNNLYAWGNSFAVSSITAQFSWTQISIGDSHILAIRNDGLLFGWGSNTQGRLGDGTINDRSSPVQIGSSSWSQVSAGVDHSLAITTDGKMFAWGSGTSMQTGLGGGTVPANQETLARSSPIQIGTANSWSQVSAGSSYSLARTTTSLLYGWGNNQSRQLGDGTIVNKSFPVQIGTTSWNTISAGGNFALGIDSATNNLYVWGSGSGASVATTIFSWTQISGGSNHVLAIRSDGLLFAWGINDDGQLGLNNTTSQSSPVQVGTSSWSQVSNAINHSLAITTDGKLFAWGNNQQGPLGDNTVSSKSNPVQIGTPNSWSQVSAGQSYSLAITTTGLLYGWGTSSFIGDGTTISKSSPVQIGTANSWSQVSAGYNHALAIDSATNRLWGWGSFTSLSSSTFQFSWTQVSQATSYTLAIRSDGLLFSWGGPNNNAVLGDNTTVNKSSPVQIGTNSWIQASAGDLHGMAIRSDGLLFGWGNGFSGVIGDGTVTTKSNPVQIGASSWVQVRTGTGTAGSGNGFTIALKADYTLWAWGNNSVSQLGDGTTINKSSPVQVATARNASGTIITSWLTISAGHDHSLAIDAVDRNLYTWGNSAAFSLTPTIFSWTKISSGNQHTLAIRNDGLLYAWGNNSLGQLGLGDLITRSSPTQIGTSSWSNVSAGAFHAHAIRTDGLLFSWGSGTVGQMGDGTNVTKSSPVQVSVGGSWSQVSGGLDYSLAIRIDGGLFAWGSNSAGRLGDNTVANKNIPTQLGTTSWAFVAAGDSSSAGIRSDGTIYSWGNNAVAQLGDFTTINKSSPVLVTGGLTASATVPGSWTQVAVGNSSMVAIKDVGTIFAWGLNSLGQLGDGTTINKSSPVLVTGGLAASATVPGSWTQVRSNTGGHITAIKSDSTVWSWGLNNAGQLGNNDTLNRSSPVQVSGAGTWLAITAGVSFTVAIKSDSTLYAWGLGSSAFIDGTTVSRSSPVLVRSLQYTTTSPILIRTGNSWNSVSAGQSYTLAIRNDSTLWSWGLNNLGQLGDNTTINKSSPVQVNTGLVTSWSQVRASNSTTFAIGTNNLLYGWGQQTIGQLNIGGTGTDTFARSVPVQIGASSWTQVAAWASNVAAIASDGRLYTWGLNNLGQLGYNDTLDRSSPTLVRSLNIATNSPTLIPATGSWSKVSAGNSFSTAIRIDGGLFAWGLNTAGQLGDNSTINKSSPVQIGTSSWAQVSAGNGISSGSYTVAIRSDGQLFGWGLNSSGQLGLTTDTISRSNPVSLSATSSWSKISAGGAASIAIRNDGTLYAWGSSGNGQLGDFTTINKSSPTLVRSLMLTITSPTLIPTNSSWNSVSAGSNYSLAIRNDGLLFGWGNNSSGQLGDNTTINKSSPTQVNATSWSQVKAYSTSIFAITPTGLLWGWGGNANGQLNIGGTGTDLLTRSSPVQIGTSSWTQVAGAVGNVGGIASDGRLYAWGTGPQGQLGNNSAGSFLSPILVRPFNFATTRPTLVQTLNSWTSVSAGRSFNLAIRSDGLLWSWGLNNLGQLGDNSLINKSSPVQVSGGGSWSVVRAGDSHSVAINSAGLLFAWGQSSGGQLGDNQTVLTRSVPLQIGASSWTTIGAWPSNSAAIASDGRLYAWGQNNAGGLGIGDTIARSSPTLVRSLNNATTSPTLIQSTGSWTKVSAGSSYSAAIKTDGSLFTWGLNAVGQLGDGTTINKSSPAQIGSSSWASVIASISSITAAITNTGLLFTWGVNAGGVLGLNDTTINRSSPVQVGTSSWSLVGFNSNTTMGITSTGTLFTWGGATTGRLGDFTGNVDRSNPAQVRSLVTSPSTPTLVTTTQSWNVISAGTSYSLAISNAGLLYGWGLNSEGQLGDNTTLLRSSPVQVSSAGSWSSVTAGNITTFAINSSGLLFGWGRNNLAQLNISGTGADTFSRSNPVQIGASSWTQIASTFNTLNQTVIGIASDSRLYAWGFNTNFQLGDTTTVTNSSPVLVANIQTVTTTPYLVYMPNGLSWNQVSAGASFSAAIRSDGTLWTWGTNSAGQTGNTFNNSPTHTSSPLQVGSGSWTSVSAGQSHAVALDNTNKLYAWGLNSSGQVGDGTVVNKSNPVLLGTSSWSQVSAGGASTFALTLDKNLYAWGNNGQGQFGDASVVNRSSPVIVNGINYNTRSPVQIATTSSLGNSSWTTVSAGASHSVAIDNTGLLYTWGLNNAGQLGITSVNASGDSFNRSLPTQVTSIVSWATVNAGNSFTNGLTPDGLLYGWGLNTSGQLGLSNIISRSSPVQISGGGSWTQIYAANAYGGAIRSDGTIYQWGLNTNFNLGDNTTVARSSPSQLGGGQFINNATTSPTQVKVGTSFSQVSAGNSFTLAITNTGALFAWGLNSSYQLGLNNDSIARSSPIQIGSLSWSSVSAGYSHAGAITSTNQLWTFGAVTPINNSSPVQITSGTGSFSQVSAGLSYTLARDINGILYAWGQDTSGQLGYF